MGGVVGTKARVRRMKRMRGYLLALYVMTGWLVPIIAMLVYFLVRPVFLPDQRFFSLAAGIGMTFAASVIAFGGRHWVTVFRSAYWNKGGRQRALGFILIPSLPVFLFWPMHVLISEVGPFVLHRSAEAHDVSRIERVTYASYGSRTCRRPAVLQGDRFIEHRRVCGLAREDNNALARGGLIELRGKESAYGFEITAYQVVSMR